MMMVVVVVVVVVVLVLVVGSGGLSCPFLFLFPSVFLSPISYISRLFLTVYLSIHFNSETYKFKCSIKYQKRWVGTANT